MKTIDFFYQAQKRNKLRDADMARALGITTASVANAKKREHLSAFNAAKCAEMAGLNPKEAIVAAAVEAEHEPEKRAYLLKILEKISANFKALLLRTSPRQIRLPAR